MDHLKMHTPDFSQENIARLAALFPNCVTESRDDKGNLKKAIDFDQLRQELSDHIVEGPQERYHLNWPGKREALLLANAPIAKTLRPCREESVDFDTTQNLYIEGDNLDALKLLQENYLGKVKMIYIDPPYNTGGDFIYNDTYATAKDEYQVFSGVKDVEGNKLLDEEIWKQNASSNGRFHSSWLTMIYPRLQLAKNLLSNDGVIMISIDENEVANLQKVCEEIFGAKNVLGNFPVVMNLKGNQDAYGFAETHEYIVVCLKSKDDCTLNQFPIDDEEIMKEWTADEYGLYKEADNLRATGVNAPRAKRRNLWYPIFLKPDKSEFYCTEDDNPTNVEDIAIWPINPDGDELSWYWSKTTFTDNRHNLILKHTSNGWQFYKKQRPSLGDLPSKKPKSFLYKAEYSTSTATTHLKALFGKKVFDGPKPVPFLKDLLTIGMNRDSLVLDFFAGSASTAHAVLQLNAEDGGNRKMILVQIPDPCDENSEAAMAGYQNIAEISKERIRRAGKKILDGPHHQDWNKDIGFRVLKVDSSNMEGVYYDPSSTDQSQLALFVENIKDKRSEEDLLFQVMLDWGLQLSLPIRQEAIAGNTVYFVDQNALAACFAKKGEITEAFCKELAMKKPLRVVFRDAGFASDAAKINVEQIFKLHSPNTDVKTL